MTINISKIRRSIGLAAAYFFAFLGTTMAPAQTADTAFVIQQVDAAVKARIESVAGYSVTEH